MMRTKQITQIVYCTYAIEKRKKDENFWECVLTVDAQSVALPVNGSLPLYLLPRGWKRANDIYCSFVSEVAFNLSKKKLQRILL